jgi:hypothetical protein
MEVQQVETLVFIQRLVVVAVKTIVATVNFFFFFQVVGIKHEYLLNVS